MTKRSRNGLLLALAAVASLVLCVWLLTPKHRINAASSWKIERGMTIDEAEAILHLPPGDYTTRTLDADELEWLKDRREFYDEQLRVNENNPTLVLRREEWMANEGVMFVFFDEGGKVVNSGFSHFPTDPGLVFRIREWLGI